MSDSEWTKIGNSWIHPRGSVYTLGNKFEAWFKVREPNRDDRWIGDYDTLERAQNRVENYKGV